MVPSFPAHVRIPMMEDTVAIFGRNRKLLDAPQRRRFLGLVSAQLENRDIGSDFSIRQLVADTLKNNGFDDAGMGCPQERMTTTDIGAALNLNDPELIEVYCRTATAKDLQAALQTATRYI